MSFRSQLPRDSSDPKYGALILEAVRTGNYAMQWAQVTSTIPGHTAKFWVSADALMIEGLRVTVDAVTQTQIGDYLDALLLTSKLADLAWFQRQVTIAPVLLGNTQAQLQRIAMIATMIEHSDGIDALLAKMPPAARVGLRATVGKDWIIGKEFETHPLQGINYGEHAANALYPCATSEPGKPCKVYQPPGTKHPARGRDITYDQIARFARRVCEVDGVPRDVPDVWRDPVLAALGSAQGVLSLVRQPNVPAPAGPAIAMPSSSPSVARCPDAGLGRLVGAIAWSGATPTGIDAWKAKIAQLPLGAIARDTVGGVPVVGRVECEESPGGWSSGVVLYRRARYTGRGVLVARTSPAPGWPGS